MTEKLYVKTRHPDNQGIAVEGEVLEIAERKEVPNSYKLSDGTVVEVHVHVDSINLPIDPNTSAYFKDSHGEPRYNIDYHVRVIIEKPQKK